MRELLRHPHSLEAVMEREHLAPADVAAFVDKTLPLDSRAELAEHIADCAVCREEVAACARLMSTAPAASGRRVYWRLLAGVAAVLVLAVTLRSTGLRRTSVTDETPRDTERSVAGVSRIAAVLPANNSVVSRFQLRFVWRRDAQATVYTVVIADGNGKPVWSDEVADTAIAPPDTTRLNPGAGYFWHVDALHSDGSSALSSEIAFRIAP